MGNPKQIEKTRSELIEWLSGLKDEETIGLLKVIMDSRGEGDKDWWDDLTDEQRSELDQAIADVEAGKWVRSEEVKLRYGIE